MTSHAQELRLFFGPEVVDLASFLWGLGSRFQGLGLQGQGCEGL